MVNDTIICKYLQIPFKDGGRDYSGCDCLGLVALFYKEIYGIELSKFEHSCYNIGAITEGFNDEVSEWVKIDSPEFGCIVAMNNIAKIPNAVNHIGIYIGNNEVLHIKPNSYPARESMRNPNFLKIMGYYVFKATRK